MKNIKSFNEYITESNSNQTVDITNFKELTDKIGLYVASIGDENLNNGFKFAKAHIDDYHTDDFSKKFIDDFFVLINNSINANKPEFWRFADDGYGGNKSVGSKYYDYQNKDIKDIAKYVKKDLQLKYEDWKFSVTISRFSGGQSLSVRITDVPYNPYTPEYIEVKKKGERFDYGSDQQKYTEQYIADEKKIESIVNAYNMRDVDSMTDYFNVSYYTHVGLDESIINQKYLADSPDVIKNKQWEENYKERQRLKKEKAAQQKGSYKKGQEIIYVKPKDSQAVPAGEYPGRILKSPNGRGMMSSYDVEFYVDKGFKDGEIIQLSKPRTYTTTVYVGSEETYFKEK